MNEDNKNIEQKTERPVLQFSVPCDGIAKGPNNKPVFVGIFSSILKPIIIPQFFIANRWINGIGEFSQVVKVLNPKLEEIAVGETQNFKLNSKVNSADIFSGFINLKFQEAGVYWITVELNNELATSYPLPVFNKA